MVPKHLGAETGAKTFLKKNLTMCRRINEVPGKK
jgi:hypothetical protein